MPTVSRAATRVLPLLLALTGLATGLPAPASAEWSLGVTGGLVLAPEQDIRVKEFGVDGRQTSAAETRGAGPEIGAIGGVSVTFWPDVESQVGLQLDAFYWSISPRAHRPPPDAGDGRRVDQERVALLASVVGRLFLDEAEGPFLYLGVGAGAVRARVRPGGDDVGPGVAALAGVAIPVTERLRLRLEARYLVSGDVDARARPGLRAETSGGSRGNVGRFAFGPHLDTQFVPLLLGLDWLF